MSDDEIKNEDAEGEDKEVDLSAIESEDETLGDHPHPAMGSELEGEETFGDEEEDDDEEDDFGEDGEDSSY